MKDNSDKDQDNPKHLLSIHPSSQHHILDNRSNGDGVVPGDCVDHRLLQVDLYPVEYIINKFTYAQYSGLGGVHTNLVFRILFYKPELQKGEKHTGNHLGVNKYEESVVLVDQLLPNYPVHTR